MKKHFKEFKPLGVLDPLFLPLFVLLCPEKELPELFLEIPLYLSSSFTLWIVRQSTILESEVQLQVKLLNNYNLLCFQLLNAGCLFYKTFQSYADSC